jgi:hypothetical protein
MELPTRVYAAPWGGFPSRRHSTPTTLKPLLQRPVLAARWGIAGVPVRECGTTGGNTRDGPLAPTACALLLAPRGWRPWTSALEGLGCKEPPWAGWLQCHSWLEMQERGVGLCGVRVRVRAASTVVGCGLTRGGVACCGCSRKSPRTRRSTTWCSPPLWTPSPPCPLTSSLWATTSTPPGSSRARSP